MRTVWPSRKHPRGQGSEMASHGGGRLECKVCWYVYDPAVGDPVWQIAAGTAFDDLPPHWSCPNCAGEKNGFITLDEDCTGRR